MNTPRWTIIAVFASAPFVTGACTVLADFVDKDFDGGRDALAPETSSIVVGKEGGTSEDAGGSIESDGATPPNDAAVVDTGPGPFTCQGQPDGTQVPGQTRRCCNGVETVLTSNQNCGACGLECNTAAGHQCVIKDGNPYCAGCAMDGGGGNGACWTGCCTVPFLQPAGVCAPEFPCGVVIPVCNDNTCETKGNASCHSSAYGTYCGY